MITFKITKKRDGQSEKHFSEIYATSKEDAIKQFKSSMIDDRSCGYNKEEDYYIDECGGELGSFYQDEEEISWREDVYLFKMKF